MSTLNKEKMRGVATRLIVEVGIKADRHNEGDFRYSLTGAMILDITLVFRFKLKSCRNTNPN